MHFEHLTLPVLISASPPPPGLNSFSLTTAEEVASLIHEDLLSPWSPFLPSYPGFYTHSSLPLILWASLTLISSSILTTSFKIAMRPLFKKKVTLNQMIQLQLTTGWSLFCLFSHKYWND